MRRKISIMGSERDYLFDNIKGYLIISVITAHYFRVSGYFLAGTPSRFIYIISFSYIMQAFLFVSGYFSKNVEKCRHGAFKQFIIPYVIFVYLAYFERCILYGADKCHVHMFMPTFALWFLVVMFFYRFFIKDLSRIPGIVYICLALYMIAGFIPFLNENMATGRIASFMIFYILGYKMDANMVEKIRSVPKAAGVITLAVLLAACFAYSRFRFPPVDILLLRGPFAEFGVGPVPGTLWRIGLFAGAMLWIFVFINLMPRKEIWLTTLGQRTMTVYLLHIFVRNLIKYYGVLHSGSPEYYGIIIALIVASLWLFSRGFVVKGYDAMIDGIYKVITLPFTYRRKHEEN